MFIFNCCVPNLVGSANVPFLLYCQKGSCLINKCIRDTECFWIFLVFQFETTLTHIIITLYSCEVYADAEWLMATEFFVSKSFCVILLWICWDVTTNEYTLGQKIVTEQRLPEKWTTEQSTWVNSNSTWFHVISLLISLHFQKVNITKFKLLVSNEAEPHLCHPSLQNLHAAHGVECTSALLTELRQATFFQFYTRYMLLHTFGVRWIQASNN